MVGIVLNIKLSIEKDLVRLGLFVILIITPLLSIAQDSTILDRSFLFKEGVYLSFSDFKNNHPIEPERIRWLHSNIILDDVQFDQKERFVNNSFTELGKKDEINFSIEEETVGYGKGVYKITWRELEEMAPNYSIKLYGIEYIDNNGKEKELIETDTIISLFLKQKLYFKSNSKINLRYAKDIDAEYIDNIYDPSSLPGKKEKIKSYRLNKVFFKGQILLMAVEAEIGDKMAAVKRGYNEVAGNYKYVKSYKKPIKQVMVNLLDGSIGELNAENVETLLSSSDDQSLYNQFKKDKKRKDNLPLYIKLYNDANPYYINK